MTVLRSLADVGADSFAAIVLEVAFNNIQKSRRHESGYALRFPRIVRIRKDKPASETYTLETVAKLFARQTVSLE